jgi:preprotein translocase subunit SecE
MPNWVPKPAEVARETIIVLGGAIVAAAIIGAFPSLRDWIKKQWGDAR